MPHLYNTGPSPDISLSESWLVWYCRPSPAGPIELTTDPSLDTKKETRDLREFAHPSMGRHSSSSLSSASRQSSWRSLSPDNDTSIPTTASLASGANVSEAASTYSYLQQTMTTRGYVSPYPLLPMTTASSASQSSTSISRTQSIMPGGGRTTPARQGQHVQSSSSGEEDAQQGQEPVRQYTSPAIIQKFRFPTFETTLDTSPTQAQKETLINALNEHRINTISELRRVERIFATLGSADLSQPMTSAWVYFVNSNSLLAELRGLTPNYPFSSDCLDEAKRLVHQDPASNRSWNYCWLVLAKVHTDDLISTHAQAQASKPDMWGGRNPRPEIVSRLAEAFTKEWKAALAQLLRYWESAPIR